jgi:hypothetical protein
MAKPRGATGAGRVSFDVDIEAAVDRCRESKPTL